MVFVERELERLSRVLCADPRPEREKELYAAQQALAWALDPTITMSPSEMLSQPSEAKPYSGAGLRPRGDYARERLENVRKHLHELSKSWDGFLAR